jgi:hypothetical protein
MVTCSNCSKNMPPDPEGHPIPSGWTVVRIEKHHKTKISISYLYLCPGCDLTTMSIQTTLPQETP